MATFGKEEGEWMRRKDNNDGHYVWKQSVSVQAKTGNSEQLFDFIYNLFEYIFLWILNLSVSFAG